MTKTRPHTKEKPVDRKGKKNIRSASVQAKNNPPKTNEMEPTRKSERIRSTAERTAIMNSSPAVRSESTESSDTRLKSPRVAAKKSFRLQKGRRRAKNTEGYEGLEPITHDELKELKTIAKLERKNRDMRMVFRGIDGAPLCGKPKSRKWDWDLVDN